ncbi:MAG: Gfo/Idh/MocA family oxidoreductase [Ruminococcaceae bacterium]|nr:Gfo/Idh/MocA family oxidoreductase [Oscillospiraceae bacterium]
MSIGRCKNMKEKVKIGYIGLGRRGTYVLKKNFSCMEDVEVTAICDQSVARMEEARKFVIENNHHDPIMTTNYKDIINNPEIDAVIIMIGWSGRPAMAVEAMNAGKYTAIEVGCSDTLQECYDIVEAYERTGSPIMMLENCCYGRREMMVLNMVKQGLFGDIIHCTGGYHHYLNEVELFKDIDKEEIPHYRLAKYRDMNRENYPTHELGPIAKVLSINRGNRFVSLTSFGSKSLGIKTYARDHIGADSVYATTDYKQSDIVNTFLTCANGETVMITLDTTLPRAYYSRNFSVRGTKGMSSEERRVVYLDSMEERIEDNEEEMFAKYDHPLHAEYVVKGVKEGHGGMDWLVCRAFIEAVKNGTNTPIDAYDTATWLAVGALSEQSIANGSTPVEFPDFTGGKWQNREPVVKCKFCLDEIVKDESVSVV